MCRYGGLKSFYTMIAWLPIGPRMFAEAHLSDVRNIRCECHIACDPRIWHVALEYASLALLLY
jgi:hypothetical protein